MYKNLEFEMSIFTMSNAKTEISNRLLQVRESHYMGHQMLDVALQVADEREARQLKAVVTPYLKKNVAGRAVNVEAWEVDIQAFCVTLQEAPHKALHMVVRLPYDTDENMAAIAGSFATDHKQLSSVPYRQRLSQRLRQRTLAR